MVTPQSRWTLAQAVDFIRDLQPFMKERNYHVLLGGGVLNTGASDKDLDLWFIPFNGMESMPGVILPFLVTMFGPCDALRDSPDYGEDAHPHAEEMVKFRYLGKRIDVFIQ